MSRSLNRRRFLQLTGGTAALAALGIPEEVLAQAAQTGQLTMAFPADVPTWDPNARSLAPVQSLYKTVFDQPLDAGHGPRPAAGADHELEVPRRQGPRP